MNGTVTKTAVPLPVVLLQCIFYFSMKFLSAES